MYINDHLAAFYFASWYLVYLSTSLFRCSCAGSKQHGHVQRVHGEFLQSVEDSRSQVGALTGAWSALQQQPGAVRGRVAQHASTQGEMKETLRWVKW